MLNQCCFEQPISPPKLQPQLTSKSLVFNAGSINTSDTVRVNPDRIPLGNDNSNLLLQGWLLSANDPTEYSVAFNVPKDAFNRAGRAKVMLHFLIDKSNTPDGDRFAIRLSSVFARPTGIVNINNVNTINKSNILVRNTPISYSYNHYLVEFDICDIINSDDFALLSVSRVPNNNDYAGSVFLTSIEFRYVGI